MASGPVPIMDRAECPNEYLVGDCLGRGAFGTVYKGLSTEDGSVVAIKKIRIGNMSKAKQQSIMMEIGLMKKLRHTNIVEYRGFVHQKDYLNIVLEFMENGSLQHLVKKFGQFPEKLVGTYIEQVLRGLVYLHDQGVIHRDIKGANILTTKEGLVKLADFGVATQLQGQEEGEVVGTPYWMAPEIIELSGARYVSDIWSVGCTVIELLTGNPPYHGLSPMTALFHIVQDDHPPLPESISPALKDFLLLTFQKDPNLRSAAKQMLRHPFIAMYRRRTGIGAGALNEQVESIKEFNKNINEVVVNNNRASKNFSGSTKQRDEHHFSPPTGPTKMAGTGPYESLDATLLAVNHRRRLSQDDQGDSDERGLVLSSDEEWGEGEQTVRVVHREGADAVLPVTVIARPSASQHVPASLGADKRHTDTTHAVPPLAVPELAAYQESDDGDWDVWDIDGLALEEKLQLKTAPMGDSSVGGDANGDMPNQGVGNFDLMKYVEEDDGEFSEFFAEGTSESEQKSLSLVDFAGQQSANHSWDSDDETDGESDPFAKLGNEEFEDYDEDEQIANEQFVKVSAEVQQLVDTLKPGVSAEEVAKACAMLISILKDRPGQRQKLISHDGVVRIMELLESGAAASVGHHLLSVVNQIVKDSDAMMENLSLIGGIPPIIKLVGPEYDRALRLEAARFVGHISGASVLTLQMFIACRGLPVLVEMLEPAYADYRELVLCATDCIWNVFELPSAASKNDFARIFAKEGALERLCQSLECFAADKSIDTSSYLNKACDILEVFSHSDAIVKVDMCRNGLAKRLLDFGQQSEVDVLLKILKCVKNLTSEADALQLLQESGVIETLVKTLEATSTYTEHLMEIQYNVFTCLYNLLKVNRQRQELAAQSGLVPLLLDVVVSNSPMKQFALPLVCDIGLCSRATRAILSRYDGVSFFLELLQDASYQTTALDVLSVWIQEDPERVECLMAQPQHVHDMITAFSHARSPYFDVMQQPLQTIVYASETMRRVLGQGSLVPAILERLKHTANSNVRFSMMKTLIALYGSCEDKPAMIAHFNLAKNVEVLESDPAIMVRELAKQLADCIAEDSKAC